MSVPSNREHHYRNLRDRYTNCTFVDGNLELTWLQESIVERRHQFFLVSVYNSVVIDSMIIVSILC